MSPSWNAAAISGEYLSAASFLGVAGLVLKNGVDMLWYPVGFAAGYLALLLFVAAPLRRSGAFTLPDFCQLRLSSTRLRKLPASFVIFIGWLYLVPQLQSGNLPAILYSLFWKRFNTTGAVSAIYGGLISAVVLVFFSPVVSGAPTAMFPKEDWQWFPLSNPGIISIPLGFVCGWLGTLLSSERNETKYAELEVRALTGAGAH